MLRTPLIPAPWADGEGDQRLWIKPESLQSIGAFKVRGAFNAIASLDDATRARASSPFERQPRPGGRIRGIALRHHGAHRDAGRDARDQGGGDPDGAPRWCLRRGQREAVAAQVVADTGGVLIPPFDHPDVIAGQGTIGLGSSRTRPTSTR